MMNFIQTSFIVGLTKPILVTTVIGAFSILLAGSAVHAAEPLRVVFRDKPPYSYVESGVQKGFLLEKTQRIFDLAHIKAIFDIMPPKRIFQELQGNDEPICSFGWYKIPAREAYARYSLPIHQDRPHVVLTSPSSVAAIRRHESIQAVMSDPSLVLAVADGVSYGSELDGMIKTFAGKVDRALVSPVQVAKKVAFKRADLMFIDQDDYDYLMQTSPEFKAADMISISFPDLPAGLKRFILCSQKVSGEDMARINAAIGTVGLR